MKISYRLAKVSSKIGFRLPFSLNQKECCELEKRVIESLSDRVYHRLIRVGAVPANLQGSELHRMMAFGMFERCAMFADALVTELNAVFGSGTFRVKSLQGHYVVQSIVSRNLYDLVTTKGVTYDERHLLDYHTYHGAKLGGEISLDDLLPRYARLYAARSSHG